MIIQRLHHAQITVPSDKVDEARDFYLGVLGLTEIPKPKTLLSRGGFWVQLGDVEIHVGTQDDVDRLASKGHVAYQVSHLEQWRNTLNQQNITILESIPIEGYDRFEFRDPFGNRVEMIQPNVD
jgi:catechol 2,3-dioxygenase-like lactoylglutathione lyase family enzyme